MTIGGFNLYTQYIDGLGVYMYNDFANVLFSSKIPYKYAPYAPPKPRKTAPPAKPREVWLKLPTQPMAMEVPE